MADSDLEKSRICNVNCCVYGCSAKKGRESHLTFHSFPPCKSSVRVFIEDGFGDSIEIGWFEAWILRLKLRHLPTKCMKVCSLHFCREDYIASSAPQIRPRLKIGVVPSQNLPNVESMLKSRKYWKNWKENGVPEERFFADKQTQTDFSKISSLGMDLFLNSKKIQLLPGMSNLLILNKLQSKMQAISRQILSNKTREAFVATLLKLKFNLSFENIAAFFNIKPSEAENYFKISIPLLSSCLKSSIRLPKSMKPPMISTGKGEETVLAPGVTHLFILDCLKVHLENGRKLKFLVSVVQSGDTIYVSGAYDSSFSVNEILNSVRKTRIRSLPKTAFMVDDGVFFGKILQITPYRSHKKLLIHRETTLKAQPQMQSKIEKTMQMIRSFRILEKLDEVSLSLIDDIVLVICALLNVTRMDI